MKKIVKKTALILFVLLLAVVSYEAFALIKARSATPVIFQEILKPKSEEILNDDDNTQKIEASSEKNTDQIEEKTMLTLADISKKRIEILLMVEDPRFYDHNGVDVETAGAGLTTIPQAIAKRLFIENFKPGFQKIEQTLIAMYAINSLTSKDEQLAVFFNTAYLGTVEGNDIEGFVDASQVYFNKSFDQLSDDEYLALVAMLIAPKKLSIKTQASNNATRVALIKQLLSGAYQPKNNADVFYGQKI